MHVRNMKQKSVSAHNFNMIPHADIPRSSFRMEKALKTSFSMSYLVPILVEEVLPGDNWKCGITMVARTAVPIVPVMDNWHIELFAFFVPNRLVWNKWINFMGEQQNPGDSISYTIPQISSPTNGWGIASLYDYFGLPTVGQVTPGNAISHSNLPGRAYNLIWYTWFRDENLQNSPTLDVNDGPDTAANYPLRKRGKRKDYFTSCLPWPQKGNTAVTLPLGTQAVVKTSASETFTGVQNALQARFISGAIPGTNVAWTNASGSTTVREGGATGLTAAGTGLYPTNLYADLSSATAATINQLRQSFQVQKLLERDARGGTRYTEIIRAHFGVVSPDARLQRPEYIGGGHVSVETAAIPQTSATGASGTTTPAGTLSATGSARGRNGFTYASTEHGHIIVLASGRADLTYSQGMRKMWSRATRYDFYFPVFAMLGEQAVLNKEIYALGGGSDNNVFGYQERWAEYRYNPSQVTGLMRPTSAGNIAYWHSSEQFASLPALNDTFIQDNSDVVLQRNFAGGAATANQQIIADILFDFTIARPLPMYSVPGLIDHF